MIKFTCHACKENTLHLATIVPSTMGLLGQWDRGGPRWGCRKCGALKTVDPVGNEREQWLEGFFTDPQGVNYDGTFYPWGEDYEEDANTDTD